MKKGKRGQFYIIAAVILIIIIIGLAGVTNYIKVKEEPVTFFNLGEQLDIEAPYVIDNGIYTGEDIPKLIENFTKRYAQYTGQSNENFQMIIVYGDQTGAQINAYHSIESGRITLGNIGGIGLTNVESITPETTQSGSNVSVNLSNNTYNFNLNPGQNFFFVITTSQDFGDYVYQN